MTRVTDGSRGDPVELLARSEVLGQLDRPELEGLVRAGRTRAIEAGDELFTAGDRTDAIQVLLVGRVRLWRLTDDGNVLVLRICPPGEILGQMSALEAEGRHSINATALEDCELLQIPSEAFTHLLERRADLGLRLARVLAERVRSLSDEVEAMKFASIGQRLVALLRRRATGVRELHVTHQELAEEVGATRENVSRLLGLLRDRGVLLLGRGRIEVLDHDRLETIEL